MQIIRTASELRTARTAAADKKIVLVPTMGGLHAGHLALARRARDLGDIVIVSIYVNPLQFGADEDYTAYPRDLRQDAALIDGLADIVYAPTDTDMYPHPQTVGISLPPMADTLCGKSRPGFFQGVATVVCKLLNQCRPHTAVFGQKDYQQAILVKLMCAQLNLPTTIFTHPTVRGADGLALSSRNAYLTADQRRRAPALHATLQAAARQLRRGAPPDEVETTGAARLAQAGLQCDYFAIRAATDLGAAPPPSADRIALAAAHLGRARLIDNLLIPAHRPA